mgnify:CR=1 FL=1
MSSTEWWYSMHCSEQNLEISYYYFPGEKSPSHCKCEEGLWGALNSGLYDTCKHLTYYPHLYTDWRGVVLTSDHTLLTSCFLWHLRSGFLGFWSVSQTVKMSRICPMNAKLCSKLTVGEINGCNWSFPTRLFYESRVPTRLRRLAANCESAIYWK